MNLSSPSQIKRLLEEHGFEFSKALGQNFLINAAVTDRIAAAGGADKSTRVLEVGPGIGCLTQRLAERAAQVTAVELDKRLLPILERTVGGCGNVNIVNADIMEFDLASLPQDLPLTVCANLPYYITTPVVMRLLQSRLFRQITVMVQKEVAVRLCSRPGSKDYGSVTAAVGYYSEPRMLFGVGAGNFMPAPKVDSAVVSLTPVPPRCGPEAERMFFRLIRAGFGRRRKTLVNALSADPGISKQAASAALAAVGVRADARAEMLGVQDFIRLAEYFIAQK